MPLDQIANIAEIFAASTIVVGLIFGWFQFREYKKRRENAVAVELMRSFLNADFAEAVSLIRLLPDGVSSEELRGGGAEYEKAAILLTTTFETMGLLTFRRIAPFSLVQELAGGIVVVAWRKLSVWLETIREEQSQPSWGEWFQWLSEKLMAVKAASQPAHLKYKKWRP
jgi:hypothetical protein